MKPVLSLPELWVAYPREAIERAVNENDYEALEQIERSVMADRAARGLPTTAKEWDAILTPLGFKRPGHSESRKTHDQRFIYFVQSGEFVKVGIAYDVKRRLVELRAGAPRGLVLRGQRAAPAAFARQIERQAHTALKDFAIGREWFKTTAKHARSVTEPIIQRAVQAHAALLGAEYYRDTF